MSEITTRYQGRKVLAHLSMESCPEDSFVQEASWLDATDANDGHPALSESDCESLTDQLSSEIYEAWQARCSMHWEALSEGDR